MWFFSNLAVAAGIEFHTMVTPPLDPRGMLRSAKSAAPGSFMELLGGSVAPSPVERRQQLHTVLKMRGFVVAFLLLVVAFASGPLQVQLPTWPLLILLASMALLSGLCLLRLKQSSAVGPWEVFAQLFADIAAFSLVLYFTGGATNPFVALYLPLLGLAAALLPWPQVFGLAVFSVMAYSVLMVHYIPLVLANPSDGVHFHLLGMWLNFIASVAILVVFVARLSDSVRRRNLALGQAERRLARESSMAALGNQAASIAHQLGTPVSTISMVVADWAADSTLQVPQQDLQAMQLQLAAIEKTMAQLRKQVSMGRYPQQTLGQNPLAVVTRFLADWRNRHPRHLLEYEHPGRRLEEGQRVAEDLLTLGLSTLMDNSSQAYNRSGNDHELKVSVHIAPQMFTVKVLDWAGGVSPELLEDLGRNPVQSHGQGIGLFLLGGLLERAGGQLTLQNTGSGLLATMELPWMT